MSRINTLKFLYKNNTFVQVVLSVTSQWQGKSKTIPIIWEIGWVRSESLVPDCWTTIKFAKMLMCNKFNKANLQCIVYVYLVMNWCFWCVVCTSVFSCLDVYVNRYESSSHYLLYQISQSLSIERKKSSYIHSSDT